MMTTNDASYTALSPENVVFAPFSGRTAALSPESVAMPPGGRSGPGAGRTELPR